MPLRGWNTRKECAGAWTELSAVWGGRRRTHEGSTVSVHFPGLEARGAALLPHTGPTTLSI